MCEPTTIAYGMAALMAASTAYSIDQQNTQANYQEAVNKQNADLQNQAAMENYKLQNRMLNEQQSQEEEATALQKHQQKLAVQKEVATQRVTTGEAGVTGLSIDSIFADVIRQGANNMTTLDRNQADSNAQRDVEKRAMQNNTWAGLQNPSMYRGSKSSQMIGAGLQIGSAAVGGYMSAGGTFGSSSKVPTYKQQVASARSKGTGFYGGMGSGR